MHVEAEMGKPCGIVYTYTTLHRVIHSPLHYPAKRRARLKASRHIDGHPLGQAARQVMLIEILKALPEDGRWSRNVHVGRHRLAGPMVSMRPCRHRRGWWSIRKTPYMLHNDHKTLPEITPAVLDHTTHASIGPAEARLEKEGGLDVHARRAPGKALIEEESP